MSGQRVTAHDRADHGAGPHPSAPVDAPDDTDGNPRPPAPAPLPPPARRAPSRASIAFVTCALLALAVGAGLVGRAVLGTSEDDRTRLAVQNQLLDGTPPTDDPASAPGSSGGTSGGGTASVTVEHRLRGGTVAADGHRRYRAGATVRDTLTVTPDTRTPLTVTLQRKVDGTWTTVRSEVVVHLPGATTTVQVTDPPRGATLRLVVTTPGCEIGAGCAAVSARFTTGGTGSTGTTGTSGAPGPSAAVEPTTGSRTATTTSAAQA